MENSPEKYTVSEEATGLPYSEGALKVDQNGLHKYLHAQHLG